MKNYLFASNPLSQPIEFETVRGMSFLDCQFFDITESGKLDGHLLDYDHPPLNSDVIPFNDNYNYYPELLEVSETSMDLEVNTQLNFRMNHSVF